jgi:hypothetical protein
MESDFSAARNRSSRKAKEWVDAAIQTVRGVREPNPWKNATDEEIAGELLRQIDNKKNR